MKCKIVVTYDMYNCHICQMKSLIVFSLHRESKPLQHFLLFPAAYKFCERKSAITRFQKKKRKRETNV